MLVLDGVGISENIAIGKLLIKNKNKSINRYKVSDIAAEILRFEKSKENEIKKREKCYNEAVLSLGKKEAEIFEIHKMMLQDTDFCASILNIIKNENLNAEYAIWETAGIFENMFLCMDDFYMCERAVDVRDISECMINFLENERKQGCATIETSSLQKENIIIFAENITPSEISFFEEKKIRGFITNQGSEYSHTSILAKAMKIPGVVGVEKYIDAENDGSKVIIDGISGKVYIDPDEKTVLSFENQKNKIENKSKNFEKLKGKESITKSGKKLKIYANVTNLKDIEESLRNDAEGIGLFRSEFLYLNRETFPSEEEQFEIYKKAATFFGEKQVIIRTLDIGTDKKANYFGFPKEENSAMGYRGIRVCLDKTEIFKTQLRAIYRASVYGNISIMLPMIISLDEILKSKEIIKDVENELILQNIPFAKKINLGIMIETPAAVLTSDKLAKEVDFFSIGTNDLTQYTLAVDRQNEKVMKLYNQRHESILKMIEITAENAHKNGIWVGICGELAANEDLIEFFLKSGIDEISVAAPFILSLRSKVRSIS